MRWLGVLGAVCLLGSLGNGTAVAQTYSQQRQNAMNHAAQVLAAESACPEYKANLTMLALIGMHYKFDMNDEATKAFVVRKAKEHKAGIEASKASGCLAAWALYGPGGQNVPDLLSLR